MAQVKADYKNKNKTFQEDLNMNHALIGQVLSLFAPEHSKAYYNQFVQDPEQQFGRTCTYLYELFGTRDK